MRAVANESLRSCSNILGRAPGESKGEEQTGGWPACLLLKDTQAELFLPYKITCFLIKTIKFMDSRDNVVLFLNRRYHRCSKAMHIAKVSHKCKLARSNCAEHDWTKQPGYYFTVRIFPFITFKWVYTFKWVVFCFAFVLIVCLNFALLPVVSIFGESIVWGLLGESAWLGSQGPILPLSLSQSKSPHPV